jgi:hypothetical protein
MYTQIVIKQEHTMLTAKEKAFKLREAIALLQDADACMQAGLGAGDLCYDLHCAIEDIEDTLMGEADVMERKILE